MKIGFNMKKYESPTVEVIELTPLNGLLNGSPTQTAITISLIDFGEGGLEDGGSL